jgi:hypothetical protein
MVAGPFFIYLFFLKLDAPRLEIIDPPKVLAKSNLFLQFSFESNFLIGPQNYSWPDCTCFRPLLAF